MIKYQCQNSMLIQWNLGRQYNIELTCIKLLFTIWIWNVYWTVSPLSVLSIIGLLLLIFFILFPGVLHLGHSSTFFKTMPQIVSTYQGLMILCKVLNKGGKKRRVHTHYVFKAYQLPLIDRHKVFQGHFLLVCSIFNCSSLDFGVLTVFCLFL